MLSRGFLLARHKAYYKFGNYVHSNLKYQLRAWFLFKFNLVRHTYVGHTNMFFCERLNSNPFSRTSIHFTIVVFDLVLIHVILHSINYVKF